MTNGNREQAIDHDLLAAYRAHYQLSINSVDIDRQEDKPCP